ncbi:MAG: nuclear transport factor 2 family protein [Pseudomonadota bacterium]|nr:nuclear transport factor 2 family protein [Pseudomonadota bacterium]
MMKTSLLVGLWLLGAMAFADDEGEQVNARAEINQAQAAYRAALLDADATQLAKIWTDDYTFTNNRGMFLSKDDRLKNIETGATELVSIEETEREVRFYGDDTAIITGQVTLEAKYSGQRGSGDYRYINVWVKQGDRWQLAANQITPIVE